MSFNTASHRLTDYDVALWPLESCEMRVRARDAGDAKRIAARSWLSDSDITAFMAEPDYWTVEEVLRGVA